MTTTTPEQALLPCPECREDAATVRHSTPAGNYAWIHCTMCGFSHGRTYDTPAEAIAAWNLRPPANGAAACAPEPAEHEAQAGLSATNGAAAQEARSTYISSAGLARGAIHRPPPPMRAKDKVADLRDGKYFALEREIADRVSAVVMEYEGRVALVSALGILELVKMEIYSNAEATNGK